LNVKAAFSHLSETVHLVQKAQNNPNALAIDAKITLEVEDQLRACHSHSSTNPEGEVH
jgi:hypothetical protein